MRPLSVLCVVDRRSHTLVRMLRNRGHNVTETYTGDHGVAVCVSNYFDAVVIDQELYVEAEDWTLAQSFKLVRPSICTLLISHNPDFSHMEFDKPQGVDAVVGPSDLADAITKLETLVTGTSI